MAGGRYRSKADQRRETTASKYIKMRSAMVKIRIAVGLGEKAKTEDVIEAVKKLVADVKERKIRLELAKLEAELDLRGGRGVELAERIDELRAELESDDEEGEGEGEEDKPWWEKVDKD